MRENICAVIYLTRGNQILLGKKRRGHGEGKYTGVGGKLDTNETVQQALVRECHEEINATPMNYRQVAELSFMKRDGDEPWHIYHHVFFADEWLGEPAESEEITPMWFEATNIPYDSMWEDSQLWLPQVLAGNKVYGEFTFDKDDKLLTHNIEIVEQLPHELGLPT